MPERRLNIINISQFDNETLSPPPASLSRSARMKELQAKFERRWLIDPEQFNPMKNCLQRERVERTWQLLTKYVQLNQQHVVDIGCGSGVFSRRMRDAGARVDAIDISENALKYFKEQGAENIHLQQGAMPATNLTDDTYDVIICTEIIAELPKEEYRLFFAELSRIIKSEGYLICSSNIDFYTVGGIEKLTELAQTEFDILESVPSYHTLHLRLKNLFESPANFIEGWKNPEFKKKQLGTRRGFNRLWFWVNTTPLLVWFWYIFEPCAKPILKMFKNNKKCLDFLEKVCRFLWDQDGISHYLFIAKRRPLPSMNANDIPIEKPKKREVWE